jgi:hypothetical protein
MSICPMAPPFIITLFHPRDGQVRVKGVESVSNKVLHPWLKENLRQLVADWPPQIPLVSDDDNRAIWEGWRQDLTVKFTLPAQLPPL